MQRDGDKVVLDPRSRRVSVGGRSAILQEKSWAVLRLLTERAPQVVSRAQFVDEIWDGNHPVGEKGLNQALWAIRAALGDDARAPRFVRTVPRVGYRWIHGPVLCHTPPGRRPWHWRALAAGTAATGIALAAVALHRGGIEAPIRNVMAAPVSVADDGTRAYLQNRRIVVDMPEGCQRIVRADEDDVRFGHPIVSSDGKHIVFQVHKASVCKLVTLELENGERQDFGSCPAWST